MTSHSEHVFRDSAEEEYYNDKLAQLAADGRLDDEQMQQCAWGAVLRWREEDD